MHQLQSNPESRMWAMMAHLSAFSGVIVPFGHIIGPLVIWLMKKDEMAFVDDQAKEALNFNISMTIYMIVSILLMMVVIGFVLAPIVAIFGLVYTIMAAVKANEGTAFRYPLTVRFVK